MLSLVMHKQKYRGESNVNCAVSHVFWECGNTLCNEELHNYKKNIQMHIYIIYQQN